MAILVAAVTLAAPAVARAYSWPLKPFDRPHPIRGAFDDPRFHVGSDPTNRLAAFHFGVDIQAADGTAVYAVSYGRVSRHVGYLTVQHPHGHEYGYWHVDPVVWSGEHVKRHQLLGYVAKGWGHLHFAERVRGDYVNPLRRGALTPFSDRTRPVVASLQLASPDRSVAGPLAAGGVLNVLADVYDLPPLTPAPPWQLVRLTPALVRWRLLRGTEVAIPWQNAVDFRRDLMPDSLYDWLYADGSYQNKPNRPGHYLFWIVHDLDTTFLGPGSYVLEVQALDTRGNIGGSQLAFTVAAD